MHNTNFRYTVSILLCILISFNCFAATSTVNGTDWDVRSTGSDNNAGGFTGPRAASACTSPGTDYSLQDTPQVTFDGVTITATTAGVSTTITITGYTVAATDKCNVLRITGGTNFVVGYYTINSVNVGANTWTLSANVTTGVGAAMVGVMGGAFATPNQALITWVLDDTVWIKKATYTRTTTITPASNNPGSGHTPGIIGYNSVHGDGSMANCPTITTATNSVHLFTLSNTFNGVFIQYICFSSTAGTRGDGWRANNSGVLAVVFDHCVFDGLNIPINGDFATIWAFIGLEVNFSIIKNSVSHGVLNSASTSFFASRITNSGGRGYYWGTSTTGDVTTTAINSVFDHNTSNNFELRLAGSGHSATLINNVFTDSGAAGVVVAVGSSVGALTACGNVLYNNTTYGFNTDQNVVWASGCSNAFGAQGTANYATGFAPFPGDITGISDPFVARGADDFSLNNTAGAGLLLRGTGFPGATGLFGTGYADVGALQSQCNSSSSGGGIACKIR